MDITPVIKAVLALAVVVAEAFLIPWIKTKIAAEKLATIVNIIDIAVAAAEQIGKNLGYSGEQKKEYVQKYLEAKGYTITDDIDNMIEAAVIELHNDLV